MNVFITKGDHVILPYFKHKAVIDGFCFPTEGNENSKTIEFSNDLCDIKEDVVFSIEVPKDVTEFSPEIFRQVLLDFVPTSNKPYKYANDLEIMSGKIIDSETGETYRF